MLSLSAPLALLLGLGLGAGSSWLAQRRQRRRQQPRQGPGGLPERQLLNWIQVLLITAVVTLLVYLLRARSDAKAKAWVKVGYLLFVIAAIFFVGNPVIFTNSDAQPSGVHRANHSACSCTPFVAVPLAHERRTSSSPHASVSGPSVSFG